MSSAASNASPRVPRQATLSDDMDYEDKHMYPPSQRSHHLESPIFSRRSVHSVSSSVESSPAAPASAKSYTNSPLKNRHSESELLVSPRNLDEYPRYEPKKKMSADFSDDTMSVGSIGNAESPKSDKGSWRIRSAVAGPFLTGPLAKDFQMELKTPRGKAREDMNFDHSGLMFPLAPVLDAIPDTPRGGYNHQPQGFTDISQFENSSQPMDGFNLDHSSYASSEQVAFNNNVRRMPAQQSQEAMLNSQYYAGYAGQGGVAQGGFDPSAQQSVADGHQYNGVSQSSAIVAAQSSNAHAPSYADVVARANGNGGGNSSEQSLVASSGSDSLESLSKGMADSMAQILAKTKNGRSFGEVQLTTLVQKIHLHMNIMGRTSAAIREDYNRIKAKLELTITDKKVLEATNYHLQQLVQQYEVERQYFHQYVLHSLQSQSSLIYESMGNLSQNVAQSKYTIEELSARLSRELSNIQGSKGNDSQLREVLEEIKRAVDVSAINAAQQGETRPHSPARTTQSVAANASNDSKSEENKAGGFKLTPVLLAVLLWIATLGGVYFSAKSAALSELQQQQSASASSILPSDLDLIVDQISQKLESAVQASEVRKLVYTELKQNPEIVENVVGSAANGLAGEISQRVGEEVKAEQRAPEVVISSESSVSESIDEKKVVEVAEAEAILEAESHIGKVNEAVIADPETPVEPAAPVEFDIAAPSDVIPPAVAESESSFVEIEVPPVKDHKQTHDALIEKLLRLNGLPGSDSSSDVVPAAGAEEDTVQSSLGAGDATEGDVATDKSAEPEDEISAKKAESLTASSVESRALDEPSPEVEAEVAASVVEAEEVIEITIESAVNPEVIVQKEEQLRDNATAVVEPVSITNPVELRVVSDDDVSASVNETGASEPVTSDTTDVLVDDVTSAVIEEEADAVKTAVEVTVDPVISSPDDVQDVKEEASESNAEPTITNELESAEAKSAIDRDENSKTQASNEEVDEEAALESKASAVTGEIKEVTIPATTSDEPEVGMENISSSGDALVQGDVDSDEGAGVSAATEQFDASTSFAGLSMALRSLASRLVDGFDTKQDEPIHAAATVVASSDKPEIASETVEGVEPVASETVKAANEDATTVDAAEGFEAVIEVPVVPEPASIIEDESKETELSNQDEPILEAEGSVESGEITTEVSAKSPMAEADAGVEPLATADEAAAGSTEETSDGDQFKEVVELAKSVEETQVAAAGSAEVPDGVLVESDGEASSIPAETTLEGAESAFPESEIAVSSIADLPSTEAGEEAGKPFSGIDQPSEDTDVIAEVSDATLVVPESVEDVSSSVEDALAINVNAVEPVDSADSPTESTVPVDDVSEKLGVETVEVDADEVKAEAKEPIEADSETESLGKTEPAITEAIDVDGNIDSSSAEIPLSVPVEAESEATADAVRETTEAEVDVITIIVDDSEVASLLANEPASEDEREAPVEEAVGSAELDAEPDSSVVSALTDASLPESDVPVDIDSSGKVDEELGDISSQVGDIGSSVAGDAIGSVEPLDPSQSSSPSKSDSNDVDAVDVVEPVVDAVVPDTPSEQLDVSSDESQPEMNIVFVDPLEDVEASKTTGDDVIASEADEKVVETVTQAEGDAADVDEPSKTADSTQDLPVASESIATPAESDEVDVSDLSTGK